MKIWCWIWDPYLNETRKGNSWKSWIWDEYLSKSIRSFLNLWKLKLWSFEIRELATLKLWNSETWQLAHFETLFSTKGTRSTPSIKGISFNPLVKDLGTETDFHRKKLISYWKYGNPNKNPDLGSRGSGVPFVM